MQLCFSVLPDQKRSGLPTGETQGKLLYKILHIQIQIIMALGPQNSAEGIHHYNGSIDGLDLPEISSNTLFKPPSSSSWLKIDEPNRVVQLRLIKESVLLLITKHFERWLAKHGKVQSRCSRRGVRKHELVGQGGFQIQVIQR